LTGNEGSSGINRLVTWLAREISSVIKEQATKKS
jgi:hypothetical protein